MPRKVVNLIDKSPNLNPWFNLAEASAHVGLSERTLRRACQLREVRFTRRGDPDGNGKLLIRLRDLEEWLYRSSTTLAAL